MLYQSADCSGSYSCLDTMSSPWYPPARSGYNFVMDTPPSNSREMRNKAEKQRRDRLNAFIGELATLVPMVARSAKKMDKTSILRLTATHLRIYQTLHNSKGIPHMQLPKHVDQYILEQLVCEQLGGFLLILTTSGKVVFISHTIENLLGHLQTDLMGQSLFSITAPDDHDRLRLYLQCEGVLEQEWRKYFNIRLKRAGPRSESAVYEPVKMIGMHRRLNGEQNQNSSPSSSSASSTANTDVMVFFVKICRPEPLVARLIEASKDEYVTRHLIDGRIINCDQRISIIAGYMIEEVSGHSAFKYMHRDDVRWVMIALRQMYDRGESRGTSCYRLQSRTGQFIYLRTFGYLEIDDQGTVESFVCVNSLVNECEGVQLIDDMKKRYSALINNCLQTGISASLFPQSQHSLTPPPSNDSIDLVEDPQQVEQAVAQLMRNLPSPGSDHRSTPSPLVHNESQDCANIILVTENSNKPYKIKTVCKRPPSTDIHVDANLNNKRQKTSPQVSPIHRKISPYPKRPPIVTDNKLQKPQQDQSIYPPDQLLRHNI